MKKLFFSRSSSSRNQNSKSVPPIDKEVYWENPLERSFNKQADDMTANSVQTPRGLFSKSQKKISDSQSSNASSGLRRCHSLSSAGYLGDGLEQRNVSRSIDQNRSPSSSTSGDPNYQCNHLFGHSATPERKTSGKRIEAAAALNSLGLEKPCYDGSPITNHDYSGNSSMCSSDVSNKILDRYIDGEQQQDSTPKNTSSLRNHTQNRSGGSKLPPRIQYTAATSPTDSVRDKPRSHSFREAKGTHSRFSSRNLEGSEFGHESPRRLAKNVIKRLSQSNIIPGSREFDQDIPITIEDIYGGSLDKGLGSKTNVVIPKSYSLDEPNETAHGYQGDDFSSFLKECDKFEGLCSVETKVEIDMELRQRCKVAEERFMLFSEELEQESFLRDCGYDVPSLVQTIRNLAQERISLALEVSSLLQTRAVERSFAKEQLELSKEELASQIKKLEKEKTELHLSLEKELDRRSGNWSLKLEKCQLEEKRLRDRVRELAEHNVSLQREVCSFSERETESRGMKIEVEKRLKDLTTTVEEVSLENQNLGKKLSALQDKHRAAEEDRDCLKKFLEEKNKECKELHKSISRLMRTCGEQEKTIDALREGFNEEIEEKQSLETVNKNVAKLQVEQMRLTGVELALRREVKSCRIEIDSLRNENINLLNRLKDNGTESGAVHFKLDKEMRLRISVLQNQGLSMLTDSNLLCSKLLEFIKRKAGQLPQTNEIVEVNGLDEQFIIELDMKVQGVKSGTASLTRSLQTMSSLLHEKSSPVALKFQSQNTDADGSGAEDIMRSELKAENLLTNLLRETLYSKELEVEQLQAELAAAVRGNDILRCEVQNTLDNLSCVTHKLKDLELQILKKDDNISQLQSNLHECTKELTILSGILPKLSEDRDYAWEEVKQHNEKNMLLNSEVNALKKKIEYLDEDLLLKEGQITILKDTIVKKPFDLLASPDYLN